MLNEGTLKYHPDDITFRSLAQTDAGAFLELMEEHFGPSEYWTREWFHWQHFQNPLGRSINLGALHGDQLIGVYNLVPAEMSLAGRNCLMSHSTGTVTHRDYHSCLFRTDSGFDTVFTRLAKLATIESENRGIHATFTFPNHMSYEGFIKLLKFRSLGTLQLQTRPVRWQPLIRQITNWPALVTALPAWIGQTSFDAFSAMRSFGLREAVELQEVKEFSDSFTALSDEARQRFKLIQRRDAPFLQWRFAKHPVNDYRVLAAYVRGRLRGYIATMIATRPGKATGNMPVGHVVDYLVMPDAEGRCVLGKLLTRAIRHLRADGAVLIGNLAPTSVELQSVFKKLGFLRTPERFSQRQYIATISFHSDAYNQQELDLTDWYVTLADDDIA